ncbi:MAG TPA: HAMP domain-containing sensor histidine kinase [Haliscomenobacter sp.]|uniref:sensor histidine kinase n=1 Tax=Haliscomenobacter sp. TaxID=2717303 RepID=UPI002C985158|nr:HAMP domain-containing sensor histidine kinase [Haliscomenobacter sp.]HOY17780.1 HAMP domain-containing sensor histidine kinase [Haliscomenobacter sp.]
MNKKAIWLIIGLMSAAVLGVILVQIDLIRTSMSVNEERFNKNVQEALVKVSDRLEDFEETYFIESVNGFTLAYQEQQIIGSNAQQNNSSKNFKPEDWDRMPNADRQFYVKIMMDNPGVKSFFDQNKSMRSLEERIKVGDLDLLIRQEFEKRGINPKNSKFKFHYGIWSNEKNVMIIEDGHYVYDGFDNKPPVPTYNTSSLYNPDNSVPVFHNAKVPPGELRVYFPNRTNIILSSLWKNATGTALFAAIILSCFAYTLTVIFRQKKLSEMKTDFINNMTHEFKTPIATISLASDSIVSPMILSNPEKVQRFANIIKQENKRMNSQVEKVLQMALLDKRDFSLKLTELNLHEIIQAAVENISLRVEKRDGVVKTILNASRPSIEGDLTHVANVINNLLDNADKYSPDKPEITVMTRNISNGVEVTVQDNGIGISKEARKQIFDKFYRVPTGNLHDVKGFGLGLSYVKAMMTAHKGSVEVKSEPGKGSSFVLTFPFQVEA